MSNKSNKLENKTIETSKSTDTTVTPCILASKANYTIFILHYGVKLCIPPFGKVNVIKEAVSLEYSTDAKFLTFIKQ